MSGKKEPESQHYWDADFLAKFGQDGRTKHTVATVDGEYLHGYLQAPVAPGLYPAGMLLDKPAMSGDYGPKPAAAKTSSAQSTAGPGPKPAASGGSGKGKGSK